MRGENGGQADALARVCEALLRDDRETARNIALSDYPHARLANAGRQYTPLESMRVFLRDGFTNRYSGARLVFPGALRLLSKVMSAEFPFHPNWKMTETHSAYWQLFPTIDHVVPVARGGTDDEPNWVTSSMLSNATKAHWLLTELGWSLRPIDSGSRWDGLVGWCTDFLILHPEHLADPYIARWHRAARTALKTPR